MISIIQSYVKLKVYNSTVTALNSAIIFSGNSYTNKFHGAFTNCYVSYSTSSLHNSTFLNSIIVLNATLGSLKLPSSSQAYNCIGIIEKGAATTIFPSNIHPTCLDLEDVDVFKEGTFYELLDQYKSFATSDGKEVGIYGGNLGFDITPSNPQITRFNVAPKTSVDGKLSIEIEVQGIE